MASRLVFWFYTDRVWEDALITVTAAANAWEGVGLTHHASEPRVLCVTSPLWLATALLGTAVGVPLTALRLASLAASAVTIVFAYRIGRRLGFGIAALALVLSYLALDHSQIFFGMAGMETQLATALLLGCVHFYLEQRWRALGVCAGLALLCRPEFALLVFVLAAVLAIDNRRGLRDMMLPVVVVVAPWLIFAVWYFGSPVPNTIVAKSWSARHGVLSQSWDGFLTSLLQTWVDVAPFRQFWFADRVPLPAWMLAGVVAASVVAAVTGVIHRPSRHRVLMLIALVCGSFIIYRAETVANPYYMWYLVPFMALYFLLVGAGVSAVAARHRVMGAALALFIAVPYAIQNVFMMPLDRKFQEQIERNIRWRVGTRLNALMTAADTAVVEPLGYVGFAARNKTIYDYPGLGSPVAVAAVRNMAHPSLAGMVDALRPTYAVMRQPELAVLHQDYPSSAAAYREVDRIRVDKSAVDLTFFGMSYYASDTDYTILRRLDP